MSSTIQFAEFKSPVDIICNGFSIKETVYEVLSQYINPTMSEELAEEIKEAFAVKMRLKQGQV